MKWIRTQEQSLPQIEGSVLTIGNFDGIHLGHQLLLKTLVENAQKLSVPSVVCTFKPHPLQVIQNRMGIENSPVHRLFDYRDQAEQMEKLKIDFLVEEKFTRELSLMSATDFMEMFVFKYFKPVHLIIGHDFSFGQNRSGDYHFLKKYCADKNILLTRIPAFENEGVIVSSTSIRQFLEIGQIEKVNQFLGRSYYLRGPVRMGYQRGRTLNVPTANISPDIEFTPRKGVYFSKTSIGHKIYSSISNIGVNPTFENKNSLLKVETHIFDFDQDIYGSLIKVELLHFLRDEMKFQNGESLKRQIDQDLVAARKYFQKN